MWSYETLSQLCFLQVSVAWGVTQLVLQLFAVGNQHLVLQASELLTECSFASPRETRWVEMQTPGEYTYFLNTFVNILHTSLLLDLHTLQKQIYCCKLVSPQIIDGARVRNYVPFDFSKYSCVKVLQIKTVDQ